MSRRRMMVKSVEMHDYTVITNQGTPAVYFDGVYVGTVSNGKLTVSYPLKEDGYVVTLKNYTVPSPNVKSAVASAVVGTFNGEAEYMYNSGHYYIDYCIERTGIERITIKADLTSYVARTSGRIYDTLTLNYMTSSSSATYDGFTNSSVVGYLKIWDTAGGFVDRSIPLHGEGSSIVLDESCSYVYSDANYITYTLQISGEIYADTPYGRIYASTCDFRVVDNIVEIETQ